MLLRRLVMQILQALIVHYKPCYCVVNQEEGESWVIHVASIKIKCCVAGTARPSCTLGQCQDEYLPAASFMDINFQLNTFICELQTLLPTRAGVGLVRAAQKHGLQLTGQQAKRKDLELSSSINT